MPHKNEFIDESNLGKERPCTNCQRPTTWLKIDESLPAEYYFPEDYHDEELVGKKNVRLWNWPLGDDPYRHWCGWCTHCGKVLITQMRDENGRWYHADAHGQLKKEHWCDEKRIDKHKLTKRVEEKEHLYPNADDRREKYKELLKKTVKEAVMEAINDGKEIKTFRHEANVTISESIVPVLVVTDSVGNLVSVAFDDERFKRVVAEELRRKMSDS